MDEMMKINIFSVKELYSIVDQYLSFSYICDDAFCNKRKEHENNQYCLNCTCIFGKYGKCASIDTCSICNRCKIHCGDICKHIIKND